MQTPQPFSWIHAALWDRNKSIQTTVNVVYVSAYRVRTVLKSPWILGEVLEKSLNSIFPWKAFKFLSKSLKSPWILGEVLEKSLNSSFPRKALKFLSKSLKSPWIFFNFERNGLERIIWCFLVVRRENVNHSSDNLKAIYIKCSMFYAIGNYQLKTSELKTV